MEQQINALIRLLFMLRTLIYWKGLLLLLLLLLLLWLYNPFVGLRLLFQFRHPIHNRHDPLDGGSALRKSSAYKLN
jgi:hypothetical protein